MMRGRILSCTVATAAITCVLALGVAPNPAKAGVNILNGPSSVVGIRQYLTHPELAPAELRARFQLAHNSIAGRSDDGPSRTTKVAGHVFNRDSAGLPQNEEAVSACTQNRKLVISGTNDYRGLLDSGGNFTGWYFSRHSAKTVDNEGLLPGVASATGAQLPSGGDPTFAVGEDCSNVYGASINYGGGSPGTIPSIEAVYRSTPSTLASCPQGGAAGTLTHPSCWPDRRAVATAEPGHFIDKDWLTTGSGKGGNFVWIAFGDLSAFNAEGNEESGVVKIVRCSADLDVCTPPIALSAGQKVAEYPTVTVGPDGRTYVTWSEFFGDSFIGPAQRGWVAVAEPGSLTFRKHPIFKENDVVRAREHLHANAFRVGTQFKNTVTMRNGHPVILATWERCQVHVVDQFCEEAQIRLSASEDLGKTWSAPRTISAGGDNVFPYLDTDPITHRTVGVWYTSRFDPVFHNRQDVELVSLRPTGSVIRRTRVTQVSNETEADPVLGAAFIGDYIQVDAVGGIAYVAYNANLRHERLLGAGVPIPQQDNYLVRVREPKPRS
jgi:hypothetical protein